MAVTNYLSSGDAFVRFDQSGLLWTCGTGLIRQELQLKDGRFILKSLKNILTGTEFVAGTDSGEFHFLLDGEEYGGPGNGYEWAGFHPYQLAVPRTCPGIDPGIGFSITLRHRGFELSLHYELVASTPRTQLGMVRKWFTVKNTTDKDRRLSGTSMIHLQLSPDLYRRLSLCYWHGGGAGRNTNALYQEPLASQYMQTFNSMSGGPGYRVDNAYSGSSSYHPYFVLQDSKRKEGLFTGFNYLGPWSLRVWNRDHGLPFFFGSQVEQHEESLKPGASFTTPNSFIGVYKGDLDSAAEQLNDWQATHKWDYTREQYLFHASIHNGYWFDPSHRNRTDLHQAEMWKIANLCRSVGAGVVHEDDFWFDQRGRGVWEGIEWKDLVDYVNKSGMHFKLWMPPQHYAAGTPPDTEHPEYALVPKVPDGVTGWYGLGLCAASRPAGDYMRGLVAERLKRYGVFYWRLDGWVQAPCFAQGHDHPPANPHVQQYRHYLRFMRDIKEAHPDMGLEGCNSGGEWCDWDKFEFIEHQQGSDGGGPDDRYYLSFFWPITKVFTLGGSSSTRLTKAKVPQLRRDILFKRYLLTEKVIGRFMRVYHPAAKGAPTDHTYLQLTDAERTKAVIFQDAPPAGRATVFPKGLQPRRTYQVTWRYAKGQVRATGKKLMSQGVSFKSTRQGEAILFNLPFIPGKGADTQPPTPPSQVTKGPALFCNHKGVALTWQPSTDNVMVAEYRVYRNKRLLDHVAIGTFYFDWLPGHSVDACYEVRAVDGDGNRSRTVKADLKKG